MESINKQKTNQIFTKFQNLTYEQLEKTAIENKPKNSDIFKVGNFCDALDETKNFCVGEIIENQGDQYRVHFEGWSNKHDIIVTIGRTKKIDHFRRNTKGYTGQKMTAYRTLNFQKEEFLQFKKLIKEQKEIFSSSEIENNINFSYQKILDFFEDANSVTQILRGKIFFKLDYFMTNPFNNQNPKEYVPEIVEVIYDYMDFSKGYFKIFKDFIFLTEINKKFPDLFLVEKSCAINASYYEVLKNLKRILTNLKEMIIIKRLKL